MYVVGTDHQLCQFKDNVTYEKAFHRARGSARCHHGSLQRAFSTEPLLPGTILTSGLYTFLPLDIWGTLHMLCNASPNYYGYGVCLLLVVCSMLIEIDMRFQVGG